VSLLITYNHSGEKRELIVCSVYLPYDSPGLPPGEKLRQLVNFSNEKETPIIIGCDANSHHVAWGSTDINSRGAALLEYLFVTHLDILNRGNEPTFVNRVRAQVIDISLASSNIWHEVRNWRVSSEVSLSDHRIIRFEVSSDIRPPYQYRNPRSTNWELFEEELESRIRGHDTELDGVQAIENSVSVIQKSLVAAYEESCPLKTANQGCKTPFWDSELGKLRKEARRSWNNRQSDPDAYHLAVKAYDKALRAAKRASWKTFCGEVDGIIPSARLHRVLSKDVSYQVGALRLPSGEFTSSDREAAEHLLVTHFPGCQPVDGGHSSGWVGHEPTQEDWDLTSEVISEDKVRWAVDGFGTFKAAGEDGIFPGLLQHRIEIIKKPITKIFAACLAYTSV
jgi:Endonuclease-reverse transcriptase